LVFCHSEPASGEESPENLKINADPSVRSFDYADFAQTYPQGDTSFSLSLFWIPDRVGDDIAHRPAVETVG